MRVRAAHLVLVLAGCLFGCQTVSDPSTGGTQGAAIDTPVVHVPPTVERLAVLYPKSGDRRWTPVYTRLEGAAFRLKEQRPTLRIVDRLDLHAVLTEQQWQSGGSVDERSAANLGHLLGVDSVLLYRVDGPTLRDLAWSQFSGSLPPCVISSKLIAVESGEVIFHKVVVVPFDRPPGSESWIDLGPILTEAMDRGVEETIADLQRAFR